MSSARLQLIPFALIILLISACATKPPVTGGRVTVAADEGLLAVRFVSNWKGNERWLFETIVFDVHRIDPLGIEMLELRSNDDAQLIALRAGEYYWDQAVVNPYFVPFDPDAARFTISPGEITYVGDITLFITVKPFELIVDKLNVEDNQDETLSRLRLDYGVLLEDYSLEGQIVELVMREP